MPLVELPEEVWTDILKRLTSVMDWGRLQQVSWSFNTIIEAKCWVRVNKLNYKDQNTRGVLEVTGEELMFDKAQLLLLLDELGRKPTKIQAVAFYPKFLYSEETFLVDVLKHLIPASLKVEELTFERIYLTEPVSGPLADLIHSISKTLKNLEISYFRWSQLNFDPQLLLEAFRQCTALESIDMTIDIPKNDRYAATIESVLFGATQLKSLKLNLHSGPNAYDPTATALLQTGAHLTNCDLDWGLLDVYVQKVQTQNLAANHPLKSLKTLTFSWDELPPLHLFPVLQQLIIRGPSAVRPVMVNAMVTSFLSHYKDAPGEPRLLSLQLTKIWGCSTLEEVSGVMDWPVSMAAETEKSLELKFVRGNAAAKLLLKRN